VHLRSRQVRAFNETKHFVMEKTLAFFDDLRVQVAEARALFEMTSGTAGTAGGFGSGSAA
jgi:hypothetical protein